MKTVVQFRVFITLLHPNEYTRIGSQGADRCNFYIHPRNLQVSHFLFGHSRLVLVLTFAEIYLQKIPDFYQFQGLM